HKKCDIDSKTQTDFKRSGTSHILAVSGMHIALLMGAVELLLRKIEVKKGIRIVIISILSIFFLALTGFVASAVRSVLMLFAVYLCYILYEENDSITALFASVAIIILFSPFAVYDLGMWMSFLATLGILAVYPYFDERMPYPKQKNLFVRYSLRFLVWIAKTLMLTIVANFFLLPIMWYFFGAVSISTLPCNLILSPIVAVLMPLCAFSTVLGFIPFVSVPFVFVTNKLFDIMMSIVRYFSEVRFGVVSLRYEFVPFLIILFAITVSIMLVVKLKHKLVIFVPMVAFIVVFSVCLSIFKFNANPYVQCLTEEKSKIIFVNYGSQCSVIDLDDDDEFSGGSVVKNMSNYAMEIDEYFIVHPDKNDVSTIESVCKNTVIRKLYLPKTITNSDLIAYRDILKCAEKYNMTVELYDDDISVEICNGVLFSYNQMNGFSVCSDKVSLKEQNEKLICEYNNNVYEITYRGGVSTKIPLN
ncbi:MAG: ComEC/Rec2 family competence protein, partial [Ruminococcaceae bacterium]|nr:ComEC/Rec2 family competence protein [Oscillospiraceae bacterium]